MFKTLLLASLAFFGGGQFVEAQRPIITDRIAITHDGNFHDKDDIGAAAMMQAILWRAEIKDSLVHFTFGNHIGANDPVQNFDMKISSLLGAYWIYDISWDIIFDGVNELDASILHLANEINISSPSNTLTIFQAGPWEQMARAFDIADPSKHQFVTIISHSNWNDNHMHWPGHRTRDSFYEQYNTEGPFEGFIEPNYVRLFDQNGWAFKSSIDRWEWMLHHGVPTHFVLWRTLSSDFAVGDMSDAGMLFWYVTGNQTPTMQEVKDFFGVL
jgi:hypothetical protein